MALFAECGFFEDKNETRLLDFIYNFISSNKDDCQFLSKYCNAHFDLRAETTRKPSEATALSISDKLDVANEQILELIEKHSRHNEAMYLRNTFSKNDLLSMAMKLSRALTIKLAVMAIWQQQKNISTYHKMAKKQATPLDCSAHKFS